MASFPCQNVTKGSLLDNLKKKSYLAKFLHIKCMVTSGDPCAYSFCPLPTQCCYKLILLLNHIHDVVSPSEDECALACPLMGTMSADGGGPSSYIIVY